MSADDNDDLIGALIASGVLLAIGYGVYRLLKSFGELTEGDEVSTQELLSEAAQIEDEATGQYIIPGEVGLEATEIETSTTVGEVKPEPMKAMMKEVPLLHCFCS